METNPDKAKNKSESVIWPYKKEAFTWYKSAEMHNVKRQIPKKVLLIPVLIVLALVAFYGVYLSMSYGLSIAKSGGANTAEAASTVPPSATSIATPPPRDAQLQPLTPEQYTATFVPRIEGFPHTAPRYDNITKPVTAPRPAACITMGTRCECYTQQGTRIPNFPVQSCHSIIKNGYFSDWQIDDAPTRKQHPESLT